MEKKGRSRAREDRLYFERYLSFLYFNSFHFDLDTEYKMIQTIRYDEWMNGMEYTGKVQKPTETNMLLVNISALRTHTHTHTHGISMSRAMMMLMMPSSNVHFAICFVCFPLDIVRIFIVYLYFTFSHSFVRSFGRSQASKWRIRKSHLQIGVKQQITHTLACMCMYVESK